MEGWRGEGREGGRVERGMEGGRDGGGKEGRDGRTGVLKISLAGANNSVPTTGLTPCIIIVAPKKTLTPADIPWHHEWRHSANSTPIEGGRMEGRRKRRGDGRKEEEIEGRRDARREGRREGCTERGKERGMHGKRE